MTDKLNRCYWIAQSAGTGAFVVDSAMVGFVSPDTAGAIDSNVFAYIAEYGNPPTEWEIGTGIYTAGTTELSRDTIIASSNSGSVVDFTDPPNIRMGVPFASDFGVANHVTADNTTPVELDPLNYSKSIITTDGSGLEQQVTLPYLHATHVGLRHLVIVGTLTNPSDILHVVPGFGGLLGDSGSMLFEWTTAAGWIMLDGYPAVPDTPTQLIYSRGAAGYAELVTPFFWHSTAEDVITNSSSELVLTANVHTTRIQTDGTGNPQSIQLTSGDFFLRKLVKMNSQQHPADVVILDNPFEMPDGSTPSAVSLNGPSDYIYVEARPLRNKWVIIEASSGVVTP